MLFKANDGNGGWVVIDDIEQFHLIRNNQSASRAEELDVITKKLTGAVRVLVPKDAFDRGKVDIGVVSFVRRSVKVNVLFTKTAYLCNDRGDTLERITVGK